MEIFVSSPQYTVQYDACGGSGAPASQLKEYGKTLTLSGQKPTRSGYTFAGWATTPGGNVAYNAGGSYTRDESVTLYAVWKQDRLINTMSGGERQRVIIARAIAQTPRIILMDEPTLHLDISMQFEALDLVSGLARSKGLTVVIVSHDLPMVARYCDRIVMIHDRNIYADGRPEDVLTPENMRTVFNVDARFEYDERGQKTVRLFGAYRGDARLHNIL